MTGFIKKESYELHRWVMFINTHFIYTLKGVNAYAANEMRTGVGWAELSAVGVAAG